MSASVIPILQFRGDSIHPQDNPKDHENIEQDKGKLDYFSEKRTLWFTDHFAALWARKDVAADIFIAFWAFDQSHILSYFPKSCHLLSSLWP